MVDYGTYGPAVDAAFNNNCTSGCTVDGANNTTECSCTQSGFYWSGSTLAVDSSSAWLVGFNKGDVGGEFKASNIGFYVRAVRCGLLPR